MKQKVNKLVFERHYQGSDVGIPFGDLPKDLLDTDTITVESYDSCTYGLGDWTTRIGINRYVEETDEEYDERIQQAKLHNEEARKTRLERYLKLKEEFEPHAASVHATITVDPKVDKLKDAKFLSAIIRSGRFDGVNVSPMDMTILPNIPCECNPGQLCHCNKQDNNG